MRDGRYEWVAFTSTNAVEKVWSRVGDADAFARVRVAAVGRSTAARLRQGGVEPDLVPARFTGEALAEALGRGSGRVLLPRVEGAPRALVAELEARGWSPHEVAAYRNVPTEPGPEVEEVSAGRFDAVTFTSASAVRGFVRALGAPSSVGLGRDQAPDRLVACIGPQTAAAAVEAGMRVDVLATEHTAAGLVDALRRRMAADSGMAR
jgi:uroporphyrinogen-III synthase